MRSSLAEPPSAAVSDELLRFLRCPGDGTELVRQNGSLVAPGTGRRFPIAADGILKPGGFLYFREPLNDFVLWRALRGIIYRLSPALDHQTARPLRETETVPALDTAGFDCVLWRLNGLLGFCLFMNSDVLIVNRLFRFVPGIRAVVRAVSELDEAMLRLPGFGAAGLQVIGLAIKRPAACGPIPPTTSR